MDGVVMPDLPEGYSWDTSDGDYNIVSDRVNGILPGLVCYIRYLSIDNKHVVRCYIHIHKEESFDNLQDALDVMATRFNLGLYFQDET